MKSNRTVSVILAGYNEEDNIEYAMEETFRSLNDNFHVYELLLVDDASRDSTLDRMEAFASTHEHVRVLRNYVNLNFGTSVLRAMLAAENEYVTYNACDLPIKPEDLVHLLQNMDKNSDVLVMERKDYLTTKWRGLTSKANILLLKLLFPRLTKGTPILNFSQIFKRDSVKKIMPYARSPIFVWPELVFRAKLKGMQVENVPVKCNITKVRKGSFGHPHDIVWGIYEMVRFRIHLWKGDY